MNKILISALLLLCSICAFAVEQVFIESDEYGQGFITKHFNRCFFVAPKHVVKNSIFLNLVGDDRQRSIGEGQVLQEFGYDLAVGSVEGKIASNCNTRFNSLNNNTAAIESNNTFAISTVNSDGMVSRQNVIAAETTLTYIVVQPVSDEHLLFKGMSGSMLYYNDLPLGMLQSIDSITGFGKVLRFDRLLETISPFFSGTNTVKDSSTPTNRSTLQESSLVYEISEWTKAAAILSSSTSMIADNDDNTAWVVQLDTEVVELTLLLPKSTEVSGLTLISDNKGSATVKNFEVLTSNRTSGKRGWISQSSYLTFPNTISNTLTWLPTKAKRIKIRFYNSWAPDSLVHINTVLVR